VSDLERVIIKLDKLDDDINEVKIQGAVTALALSNLNAELQEHKKRDANNITKRYLKFNRNLAAAVAVFAALSCWIAYKGLIDKPARVPVVIVKEISNDDNPDKDK
jgi:hypothetical protein